MCKTVWVTGPLGFLGSAVVEHYLKNDWKVIGIGRSTLVQVKFHDNYKYYSCGVDFVNLTAILKESGAPDLIVHCAGSPSVSFAETNPEQDIENTIKTSIDLARLQNISNSTRIIFASSAAVYGNCEYKIPFSIHFKCKPSSVYGANKLIAENIFKTYAQLSGARTTAIRFFSIYGPGLRKQILWDAYHKLLAGNFIFNGSGSEIRDFIHISDAVRVIYRSSIDEQTEPYRIINCGSGVGVSIRDLLVEFASLVLERDEFSRISFNGNVSRVDPTYMVADVSDGLDFQRINLSEGLRSYYDWIKGLS
jgi:UDP-glucose 4-epimerase